ncbi:MAG: hypothetical protein Q4B17_10070 [Lautropia sp.]|nr:hypothetical protein [Lautropia sp.]
MPEAAMDTAPAHQGPSSGDTHQAALNPFHSPSKDMADASGSPTDGGQLSLLSGGERAGSTVTAVDAGSTGLSGTTAGVSAVDVWLGALATQALAVNRMMNHADAVRARNAAGRATTDAHAGRTGDSLADQAEKPARPVDPIHDDTAQGSPEPPALPHAQPGKPDKTDQSAPDTTGIQPDAPATDQPAQPDTAPMQPAPETSGTSAPHYPETPLTNVTSHDGTLTFDATVFAGKLLEKRPAFIRIVRIESIETVAEQEGSGTGLRLNKPDGGAIVAGQIIEAEDFDKIVWDGTGNQGGHFSFRPLDANRQAMTGIPEQTIEVEVHPPAPTYPPNQAPLPVAHDASLSLSRIVFTGTDQQRLPAAVRITLIEEQNKTPGSGSPLSRSGNDGQHTPLAQGDVIDKADFSRIVWHAGQNEGGRFGFVPLTANGKQILGSSEQTLSVHEHPIPPGYPAQHDKLHVEHHGLKPIAASVLAGDDPGRQPAAIRITAIEANSPDDTEAGTLIFGPRGQKVSEGWLILARDFDQLAWDSTSNAGGHFRFVAANADGTTLLGSPEQTVNIFAHPLPPNYSDQDTSLRVAHDAGLQLDASHFTGADSSRKPFAIRITSIDPQGQHGTDDTPLTVSRPGEAPRTLGMNSIVEAADFAFINWQAAGNQGGRFSFEAINADGSRILGSAEQTISIHEHAALPAYPDATTLHVPHDVTGTAISAAVFNGADPQRSPPAVRIQAIETVDGSPLANALTHADGTPVTAGERIAAEAFGSLRWNAQTGENGRFRFVPVNADGSDIPHAVEQSVTVHESPLPPAYEAAQPDQVVVHDAFKTFDASLFEGTVESRKPAGIRITAIRPAEPSQDDSPLLLGEQASAQKLNVGDVIDAARFGEIGWHAQGNAGGDFRFIALDAAGRPILKADGQPVEHSIRVAEGRPLPAYASSPSAAVAHDQSRKLPESLFTGTDPARAPAGIRILSITPNHPDNASPTPLLLDPDGEGNLPAETVQVNQVIDSTQFDRLIWNAAGSQGGSFRFEALDEQQHRIPGSEEQTVTIREAAAPPVYPQQNDPLKVVQNGTIRLSDSLFNGTDDARKPPAIRIEAIDPEAPEPGAVLPLKLDADGSGTNPAVSVQVNQVIPAEHFDRLSWDSSINSGGSFRFVPVNADGGEWAGAAARTVTISEGSSPAPAYPEPTDGNPEVGVALDRKRLLPASLFAGTDPTRAPEYIRIDWNDGGYGSRALFLRKNGWDQPLSRNQIIHRDDFDKVVWDAQHNSGGTIHFDVLDADQQPLGGVDRQSITVYESPAFPIYFPIYGSTAYKLMMNPFGIDIPYGARHSGMFLGTAPDYRRAGSYGVRFESIDEIGDTNPGVSALRLSAVGGKPETEIRVGDIIMGEDIRRIIWRSSETTGGSFSFRPVDDNKRVIEGGSPIRYQVIESGPDPKYEGKVTTLDPFREWTRWGKQFHVDRYETTLTLPFRTLVRLDKRLFTGTDDDHPPASIKFTTVFENDDVDSSYTALTIRRENGEIVSVREGDVIRPGDFGNLYWDTNANAGGTLGFYPQDQNGKGVVNHQSHYVEVMVRVKEADPPTSTGDVDRPVVGHDQITMIAPGVFHHVMARGSSSNPLAFKVLAVTETLEDGRTRYVHALHNQGTTAYELIRLDAPITREEAMQRAQAAGGTLLSIDNDTERQWLDEYLFKAEGLRGDDVMHAQSTSQTLSAFVIEQADHHNPLRVYGKGQHWDSAVTHDNSFGHGSLERMGWDSTHNTGGSIVIGQMSSTRSGSTLRPETVRTIRLTETPAPAPTDPQDDEATTDDDRTSVSSRVVEKSGIVLTAEMLTEGAAASGTPPSSHSMLPDRHALALSSLMDSALLQDVHQEPPLI